jgi:DNA primase catalytic subunit
VSVIDTVHENVMRKNLRAAVWPWIDSVAMIRRQEDTEFAALAFRNETDYNRILEFLTNPDCPFTVTRETPTRVYIAYQA